MADSRWIEDGCALRWCRETHELFFSFVTSPWFPLGTRACLIKRRSYFFALCTLDLWLCLRRRYSCRGRSRVSFTWFVRRARAHYRRSAVVALSVPLVRGPGIFPPPLYKRGDKLPRGCRRLERSAVRLDELHSLMPHTQPGYPEAQSGIITRAVAMSAVIACFDSDWSRLQKRG